MSRFVAFGNGKRFIHSLRSNGKASFLALSNENGGEYNMFVLPYSLLRLYCRQAHSYGGNPSYSFHRVRKSFLALSNENGGEYNMFVLPYSLLRLYCRQAHSYRGNPSYSFHRVRKSFLKRGGSRNFNSLSANSTVPYHAQVAWKKLSSLCAYNASSLSPINRIACVLSLALTRSNLVGPSLIALIIGELAWSRRTWAEAEGFLTRDALYTGVQTGHVYLLACILAVWEGVILLLRAVHLVLLFFPCIAMAPLAASLGSEFRKVWLHLVHLTLEQAGPAFIKWGQWAATRPDLFAQDLCTELAKLHSKAPAHSFHVTKKTIEKAFGRKLSEIFINIDEEPIASGSVAQVHRATLRYKFPGQEIKPIVVAVKVRHPSVGNAIRRDFILINFIAKISRFIPTLNWLRLDESIQQFAVYMMSQVDLAREAAHLNRFIYNFRTWKDVSFPRPLYPLVHPAVLVETYERGENVLNFVDEFEGNESIKSTLARIGTHALLKMLLVDNFIHADMHPGNVLVRLTEEISHKQLFALRHPGNLLVQLTDNKISYKQLFGLRPHVVFLDVGMTAELSKRDRLNLLEFFKAVALQDGRTVAECTLKLSKCQSCPNPRAFIEDVEKCFNHWRTPEGRTPPGVCMQRLLELVRCHRVNIEGDVCTVIVTTLVLEGWQRKLDPDYDVMQTLRSLLFKADWADSLIYTIEGVMAP